MYAIIEVYRNEVNSMFLKKTKHKNKTIYLSICKSFRDPITKKTKQKTVKSLGYLHELEKEFDDPIAHFTEIAKQMTSEENTMEKLEIIIDKNERMTTDTNDLRNIGFAVISKMYHEIGIHKFLINRQRGLKSNFPLNNIMKLLIYTRILDPGSKFSNYENRHQYIENFDFPLESLYRSLKVFAKQKDKLILDLHENINMIYPRDTENVFYDVTNYYFHTEREDDFIQKGVGKDRKDKKIVQMGLLLDNQGLPMTYKLFKGNTSDFETLLPILDTVKQNFNLKRVIVVADKGLNSGTNKGYNIAKGDGYIFSKSLRGTKANKDEKEYALSEEGYMYLNDDFKIKSRVLPTYIWIENDKGKSVKVDIDEKHVVFYSEKYARRTKHKREKVIEKAKKLIESPSRYLKADNYGALKYIKGMKVDKSTGEIQNSKSTTVPTLDMKRIQEEEQFDGYYSIVTSELDMPDSEIIDRYRGLWKIEETFKVSKSVINARPVHVWKNKSIEAHFLTCFISLLILRILEMKTNHKYSIEKIINSLKKSNVCLLESNKYKAVYYDEILKHIDDSLGTTLDNKYLTSSDIKKLISDTK